MDTYITIKAVLIISFWYIYYLKISGLHRKRIRTIIIGLLFTLVLTILIMIMAIYVDEPLKSFLMVLLASIFLRLESKQTYASIFIDAFIAYAISCLLYMLSTVVAAIISYWIFRIQVIDFRIALCTGVVEILLTIIALNIKINITLPREKHITAVKFLLSDMIIIFYTLLRRKQAVHNDIWFILMQIVIFFAGLIYWFHKEHIITFNNKVKTAENANLQACLNSIQEENKFLDDSLRYLEYRLHKEDKRLPAYQEAVEELIHSSTDEAAKKKALRILHELQAARNELSQEQSDELRKSKILPLSGMILLDAIFADMCHRAAKFNIDFELILENLHGITAIITQTQLEILASDLIVNAIIAVMYSSKNPKCILVYAGMSSGIYELRINDSGIPFEMDIFFQLGKHRITTHKDSGGSGIGFMTIFEIIDSCGASLYITENPPGFCPYSKAVTIRFDHKAQKVIQSYRSLQIAAVNDGRWIIEDVEEFPQSYIMSMQKISMQKETL